MGFNPNWCELIYNIYNNLVTFLSNYPQLFDLSRQGDKFFVSLHCTSNSDSYPYCETTVESKVMQVSVLDGDERKKELKRVIEYSCVLLSQASNNTMKSVTLANNIRDNLGVVRFLVHFHHRTSSHQFVIITGAFSTFMKPVKTYSK